jgi:hypothetical protein
VEREVTPIYGSLYSKNGKINMSKMCLILLLTSISLLGCTTTQNTLVPSNATKISWNPEVILTLIDAERILGEGAHLRETLSYLDGSTKVYTSTYLSNNRDEKSGKTGALYYMIEEYENIESARLAYESIRAANENAVGVVPLSGVGSEAYFHSDGENFLFVLIRNENFMIRMKVNKVTSHTDEAAFKEVYTSFWK